MFLCDMFVFEKLDNHVGGAKLKVNMCFHAGSKISRFSSANMFVHKWPSVLDSYTIPPTL